MTTSSQQQVLTVDELKCLRDVATGRVDALPEAHVQSLVAKGMLDSADPADMALTPAGHHAVHVDEPGMLPGIDE